MSGGGEIRVLRQDQEPGQESPRMPAWKREILERRRAKGGAAGATGAGETSPSAAAHQRHNGSATVINGSKQDNGGGSGANGRNYTITTASQHFGNNKETRHTTVERATSKEEDGEESLVLQESLGPLEENPFIKLEKERRRRQDRDNAARPVQHILELYGSVPGIRTIRAENIIIIESDPEYFPDGEGSNWQPNGVSTYSSLNDLLDRRGSAVTEIRAKEVVIYDTTLSKSEENLSTLGRPDHELQAYDTQGEGQGRVSRMLQKFDSNYGKLQKKSHSTENLLDLDCSASSRPRSWSKPDVVPKPRFEPATPVFQSPGTSKPKAEPESPQRTPNHSVHSFRQRFEDGGSPSKDETDSRPSKPTREREWDSSADPKPKVPCSPETRRARAESSPSKTLRSTPDFEIRPSPKPDLSEIPDNDTQARALANLRLQSKNSFTVIPKRRLATSGSSAASPIPAGPVKSSPSHRVATGSATGVPTSPTSTATTNDLTKTTPLKSPLKSISNEISKTPTQIAHETSMTIPKSPPSPTKPVAKPVTIPATLPKTPPLKWDEQKQESLSQTPTSPPPVTSPPAFTSPPSSPRTPVTPPLSPSIATPPTDHLPITNIDDIEVEPPQRVPAPSPLVHRRKGNTFTVVPKRKIETEPPSGSPESQTEALSEAPGGSTPPQAPYSQLGTLLKKRYPAVEEIEVIGGYLSLAKSCLVKTGSSGKKLKISFNESNLHSTYEYPSETSVWDSEDEDAERGDSPEETPSMVGRIHIPRAGLGLANNANDLSNYIPKHAVDYSTWQEQRGEESAHREEVSPQPAHTEDIMLTPADSSSLSDFSSEPALYF
ncbi:taperin [Periophthalmus magnuspinnatus]|uniref:taperin n=1 Tax=Periophthalmus magnuspinnatus TaxID=409849 RepID=UPI00145A21B1|nr:taperin [Periophthalmus magnuspinnatus]